MQEEVKTIIDGLAVGGGIATIAGWLPDLTALLTIVWLTIRIWESPTIQSMVKKDGNG
jgi:hypothetical protein